MVEIVEAVIAVVGAIIEAIVAIATIVIEFPILLIPILVGVVAAWMGGVAGWVCFIAVQLATTAGLKRRVPRDRVKVLVAWGLVHLIPLGACAVFFIGRQQTSTGIAVASIWALGFLFIAWKVPSPPEVEQEPPSEPQK